MVEAQRVVGFHAWKQACHRYAVFERWRGATLIIAQLVHLAELALAKRKVCLLKQALRLQVGRAVTVEQRRLQYSNGADKITLGRVGEARLG